MEAHKSIRVTTFTGGLVGPSIPMLGPVVDGGTVVAETAPGCWGPMITPSFKGGHEVTQPVAVAGAEVGDAVALHIKRIQVTSLATASGTMSFVEGRYMGDPFVARKCPQCATVNPPTVVKGIGQEAIRCTNCGAEVSPFRMSSGYTIVLDQESGVAVTVDKRVAEELAKDAGRVSRLPERSEQHSILVFGVANIAGVIARMRPFLGNIGTTPSRDMPDSHNAGDFGTFLIDAPHEYAMTQKELDAARTDGHMDVDSVRAGAILICPVKVAGAGVYMGDMHAQQGDGEIAGHTTDVSGEVEAQVEVIKGLGNDGPILLPPPQDLPFLARPFTSAERAQAWKLANQYGQSFLEEAGPVQVIGSGANLNDATENGLHRMAKLASMSYDEVRNRVTISGAVEVGRLPGVVTVTMLCPMDRLEKAGIAHLVREQYGL